MTAPDDAYFNWEAAEEDFAERERTIVPIQFRFDQTTLDRFCAAKRSLEDDDLDLTVEQIEHNADTTSMFMDSVAEYIYLNYMVHLGADT